MSRTPEQEAEQEAEQGVTEAEALAAYDLRWHHERVLELVGSNTIESYNVLSHSVQRALCGLRIISERIAGDLQNSPDEYELLQSVIAQLETGLELQTYEDAAQKREVSK